MAWMKIIGGVLAGVLVAGGAIGLMESQIHAKLKGDSLFVGVAVSYGIAAMLGSMVAFLIGGATPALAAAVLLFALAVFNLFAIAHPGWFLFAAALTISAGWWAGTRIARNLPVAF